MNINEVIGYIRSAEHITFIIGAGASQSAGIPTARELVKAIAEDFSHCIQTLSVPDRNNYGKVMGALSPADRKRLIEPLLENEKMNWGHIALANVIKSTNVRRVLSFNFDFLLERAMSFLGSHLPVYDFGAAPSRHITGLADKAIFHLHGQSYGLTLLNTDKETLDHAEKLKPLLSDSLRNHLTVVIGYSGEADAAFDIMNDTFDGNNNLIWLGFEAEPSSHLRQLLRKKYTSYLGNCDFDRTMLEIAQGVGCWPIPILDNPPAHLLKLLEPLPNFPVGDKQQTGVLTQIRTKLEINAIEWERTRTQEEIAASALISGRPDWIDSTCRNTSSEFAVLKGWGLVSSGDRLVKEAKSLEGEKRTKKFAEAYKKYAEALECFPEMHEAYHNWGTALGEECETLDSYARVEKYAEAYKKFKAALEIKPDKNETLCNWANILADEAKTLDGDPQAQKFAAAFEKHAAGLELVPYNDKALHGWGNALADEGLTLKGEAQKKKFAEAYKKYSAALKINPDNYLVLFCWGVTLGQEARILTGQSQAGKFEAAYEKLAATLVIRPRYYLAFYSWGCSLTYEAMTYDGDARAKRFAAANEKYSAALENGPHDHKVLDDWAYSLANEAEDLAGEPRSQKFAEVDEKFAAALEIKPDNPDMLHRWGVILGKVAQSLEGRARAQKFEKAYEKFAAVLQVDPEASWALESWGTFLTIESKTVVEQRAEKLELAKEKFLMAKRISYEPSFNYVCALSLRGEVDEALDELETLWAESDLPGVERLSQDEDLENIRKIQRFNDIVERKHSI